MISCVCGLPGKGKTSTSTYMALLLFRIANTKRERKRRLKNNEEEYFVNIYSNYSIKLNDKPLIYSRVISLFDLDGRYRFLPGSSVIIDEPQLSIDSDEFQDKKARERLRPIARYCQRHRHNDILNIYFVSQHPVRIPAKLRQISEQFYKIKNVVKIPFINVARLKAIVYYQDEDYGQPVELAHNENYEPNFDYDIYKKWFKYKNVYKAYDSKYLRALDKDKPFLDKGYYTDLLMNKSQIDNALNDELEHSDAWRR